MWRLLRPKSWYKDIARTCICRLKLEKKIWNTKKLYIYIYLFKGRYFVFFSFTIFFIDIKQVFTFHWRLNSDSRCRSFPVQSKFNLKWLYFSVALIARSPSEQVRTKKIYSSRRPPTLHCSIPKKSILHGHFLILSPNIY